MSRKRARAMPPPRGAAPVVLQALALALAGAVLVALAPGLAGALSERELERKVQEITHQLRCPTCQAISVQDSEAAFSRQIRAKVRRMVEEGQSEEAIKSYFVSRYGEWILRAPKKEGLGLVLWLAPGAALLGAGGLIGYRLYRTTRAAGGGARTGGDASEALTPEQRERVAQDLRRFEEQD